MRLDVRGVDRRRTDHPRAAGQRLEHRQPDALPLQRFEAVVDRRVRPYSGGQSRQRHSSAAYASMPLMTRLSSTRCAPRRPRGNNGSICSQSHRSAIQLFRIKASARFGSLVINSALVGILIEYRPSRHLHTFRSFSSITIMKGIAAFASASMISTVSSDNVFQYFL